MDDERMVQNSSVKKKGRQNSMETQEKTQERPDTENHILNPGVLTQQRRLC